jgi:hypothetical protein
MSFIEPDNPKYLKATKPAFLAKCRYYYLSEIRFSAPVIALPKPFTPASVTTNSQATGRNKSGCYGVNPEQAPSQ